MTIAKNQNTYAKRQREANKKAKAEAKRIRRKKRKQLGETGSLPDVGIETPDDESADVEPKTGDDPD